MASRISSVREAIDRALHDDKQPWTKYFVICEEKTGVKRSQLFIGLVALLAAYLVIGYGSQLLCNIIGFAYPAYCSMKAIETRQKEDDTKWLTYWVVFAAFSVAEYFSCAIVRWIPIYWLLKCTFLIWCFLPFNSNGSQIIYTKYIRPYFQRHENDIDTVLSDVGDKGNTCNLQCKISIKSEDLVKAVDHVLVNYCSLDPFLRFTKESGSGVQQCDVNLEVQLIPKSMLPENLVLNELNADLWDRALFTLLGNISTNSYPHYVVVQKFINYALVRHLRKNACFVDYGLLSSFFLKLLLFHPPTTAELQQFYWFILNDKYVTLDGNRIEEQNIFWCLIEILTSCLENPEYSKDFQDNFYNEECHNEQEQIFDLLASLGQNTNSSLSLNKKIMIYFENLAPVEKLRRVLLLLRFVCDVLESDMLRKKELGHSKDANGSRSFISSLLWQDTLDLGIMNTEIKKLINLFGLVVDSNGPEVQLIHELMSLLADAVRMSDIASNPVYPFFGNNSKMLAYNISLIIIKSFEGKSRNTECMKSLKPQWLRLIVCSNVLTYLTGKFIPPELSSACEVLEFLVTIKTQEKVEMEKSPGEALHRRRSLRKGREIKQQSQTSGEKAGQPIKRSRTLSDLNLNTSPCKTRAGTSKGLRNGTRRPAAPNVKGKKGVGHKNGASGECGTDVERSLRILLGRSGADTLENVPCDRETLNIRHWQRSSNKSSETLEPVETLHLAPEDTTLICDLCIQLIVSYFVTHRTWDVYRQLKALDAIAQEQNPGQAFTDIKWDYLRYHSDIKENIGRLRSLVPELANVKEFKNFLEPLARLLSFNY